MIGEARVGAIITREEDDRFLLHIMRAQAGHDLPDAYIKQTHCLVYQLSLVSRQRQVWIKGVLRRVQWLMRCEESDIEKPRHSPELMHEGHRFSCHSFIDVAVRGGHADDGATLRRPMVDVTAQSR
eukprot:scaffold287355_cov33-Tisochrysis_lutea.AAC.2